MVGAVRLAYDTSICVLLLLLRWFAPLEGGKHVKPVQYLDQCSIPCCGGSYSSGASSAVSLGLRTYGCGECGLFILEVNRWESAFYRPTHLRAPTRHARREEACIDFVGFS